MTYYGTYSSDSPLVRVGHRGGEGAAGGWVEILPVVTAGTEIRKEFVIARTILLCLSLCFGTLLRTVNILSFLHSKDEILRYSQVPL